MPVTLSIKNAPDDVVQRLRARAARNHRSLQGELMAIIADAAEPQKYLTPLELLAHIRTLGVSSASDSADIIRADRDRDDRAQGC